MRTVVLIDEDLTQRNAMSSWLAEEGWRILIADDGESGLDLALKNQPEMVVCDLLMSRCNGFQLSRMIRKEEALRDYTTIVVTTGGGYPTDRSNAMLAGADECLVKPIQKFEFMRLVERLLKDREAGRSAQQCKQPAAGWAGNNHVLIEPALPINEPTRMRFWGVRGSIPTPGPSTLRYGGNTACLEVRADGQIIILDAGTGIAPLGSALAKEFEGRPFGVSVLISHTHWDHIQGFPFFEPAYDPKNSVCIMGFKGAREGLETTLSSQMESPYFPISMAEMPSNISIEELRELSFSIGQVRIEATYLNHPGLCIGYRINSSCGSIAYLPDNEPYQRFKYHTSDKVVGGAAEAIEYARRQDQRVIDFIKGVDALIIDSQYDAEEYPSRIGWGHGCVDDVVALALSAKVKRLFLFHHDPKHDDEHIDRMVEWARNFVNMLGEQLEVDAAREGMELVLDTKVEPQ